MRPFKMFFGFAIFIMLFSVVAKFLFIAFIIAAVMSIIYAVVRRIKHFITFDKNGEYYMKEYRQPRMEYQWKNSVEPLFHDNSSTYHTMNHNTHFIKTI